MLALSACGTLLPFSHRYQPHGLRQWMRAILHGRVRYARTPSLPSAFFRPSLRPSLPCPSFRPSVPPSFPPSLPSLLQQANGFFLAGIYVGGGLSSLSIAIAESVGWRGAAYLVSTSGFLLALLVGVTVKEPLRIAAATPPAAAAEGSQSHTSGPSGQGPEGDQTFTVMQR